MVFGKSIGKKLQKERKNLPKLLMLRKKKADRQCREHSRMQFRPSRSPRDLHVSPQTLFFSSFFALSLLLTSPVWPTSRGPFRCGTEGSYPQFLLFKIKCFFYRKKMSTLHIKKQIPKKLYFIWRQKTKTIQQQEIYFLNLDDESACMRVCVCGCRSVMNRVLPSRVHAISSDTIHSHRRTGALVNWKKRSFFQKNKKKENLQKTKLIII